MKRFPNQKDDNKNFLEIIKKNRPLLSSNSIKTYMSGIRKIQSICGIELSTPEDLIKEKEKIVECLQEKTTPIVRKSKIAALIVILDDKEIEHSEDLKSALVFYRKIMNEDADTVRKKDESQEMSDKQKENLISQNEVVKVYEEVKAQAKPLMKLSKLNKSQFQTLQQYVLLSLYVLIPPRRSTDYAVFKIRNWDDKDDNYMINFNKNKTKTLSSFVFNTYKNSTRLGRQVIEIPKPLEKIIDIWKTFNKSDYLLVNTAGNPITQSKIAYWLNEIFGKNISSGMLRHIFISDKYKGVNLAELKSDAYALGQSRIERTLAYVDKDYDEIVKKNAEDARREKEKED